MNRFLAAAVLAAAVLPAGCSPSGATATGEVTYDGQPVGDGYITFTPTGGSGRDTGAPISGGKYTVSGLTPGPMVVKVIAVKKVNFASSSEEMMKKAAEARQTGKTTGLVDPADTIPDTAEGNNAKVDISPGENKLDFHLKPPVRKK